MTTVVSASDVIRSLQSTTRCDYLHVASNDSLIRFLDKNARSRGVNVEMVLFSDSVLKINKRGKQQKRDLIITTSHIYNFKPKVYKATRRAIVISKLKGILLSSSSDEVLIQVRGEYDYRLLIVRQADVVKILSEVFEAQTQTKLSVSFADDVGKLQVLKGDIKAAFKRDVGNMNGSGSNSSTGSLNSNSGQNNGSYSPVPSSMGSVTPVMGMGMSASMNGMGGMSSPSHSSNHSQFSHSPSPGLTSPHHLPSASISSSSSSSSPIPPSSSSTGSSASSSSASSSAENSRDNSDVFEQKPTMEGWLTKRGVVNNQWRRRFFRLSDCNLLYYEGRIKGSAPIDTGEVRQWVNKRLSVDAAEHLHSQSPHHLNHILSDPDRARCFLKFCQSKLCAENVSFYLAVEQFKAIANSAEHEQQSTALRIFLEYVIPGAPQEITAPQVVREALHERIQNAEISLDLFNPLQQLVLAHMKVNILPQYLEYSKKKEQQDEDYKLKTELTEEDKRVSSCSACLAPFSMIKRRHLCKFCGEVLCSDCLSKSIILPPQYGVSEAIKVCDMCHGVLVVDNHPHAFSYASPSRRPIHLAAPTSEELNSWLITLKSVITLQQQNPQLSSQRDLNALLYNYHKEGFLMKEDPSTKIWRRRYFVLDGNRLWYYEFNLKGSFSLAEGAGVHANPERKATLPPSESTFGGLRSYSNFEFRFNISHKQRLYAISGDTEEQMLRWIDAIQKAIRKGLPDKERKPVLAEQYAHAYEQEAPVGEVTFVFTDVQNSTKLWEAASEAMNKALELHDSLLRMLLKQFRGYEVKTEGDAFMVTFFNTLDAVRWCIAVQRALLEAEWPEDVVKLAYAARVYGGMDGRTLIWNGIRIRMGIHVGTPSCRRNPVTGRMDYFGPTVNRTARVNDSAHGGQIICTEEVRQKVLAGLASGELKKRVDLEDLGDYNYKGISEPVRVYQITGDEPGFKLRNPFPALRISKKEEQTPASAATPQPIMEKEEQKSGGGMAIGYSVSISSGGHSNNHYENRVSASGPHLHLNHHHNHNKHESHHAISATPPPPPRDQASSNPFFRNVRSPPPIPPHLLKPATPVPTNYGHSRHHSAASQSREDSEMADELDSDEDDENAPDHSTLGPLPPHTASTPTPFAQAMASYGNNLGPSGSAMWNSAPMGIRLSQGSYSDAANHGLPPPIPPPTNLRPGAFRPSPRMTPFPVGNIPPPLPPRMDPI